jgi:hypothetical protein
MKKIAFALAPVAALALAACGSTDDASADAQADTVEMPADEALAPVTETPVEDTAATPAATDEATPDADAAADAAGDAAVDAAADVAAEAANAAEKDTQ